MKTRALTLTIVVALAGMFAFSTSGIAAPGGGGGPGGGPGGGGGGSTPPDLGDLFVLYRDAYGVPYLTADNCQQPLPSDTCPETCTLVAGVPAGTDVIPVDPDTCAATPACAICTQEVDFGRTNVIRSPASVLEQQLTDVLVNLATADCISLDPAGRLVTSTVIPSTVEGEPDEVLSGAIDSPLQNLAIYWQLMQTPYLGTETAPLELPDVNYLNTAARGVGAANDKTGEVSVDMLVYVNEILGLTDESLQTVLPKICINNIKEEVKGVVQNVRKCFLNYGPASVDYPDGGGNYSYLRTTNFSTSGPSLPNPAYIPESAPMNGWFEYLALYSAGTPDLFYIYQGPILQAVFPDGLGGSEPGFTDGNLGGFTQAADDTRAVIDFMHSNPLPLGYETTVPCDAIPGGDAIYDVSISDVSGLQVPVQMVDGSEGREFIVTVANAGPDVATGDVTVTADAANGVIIVGSPWTFEFTLDPATNPSQSFPQLFSINLGERTKINWTATATTDCALCDANPANNSVIEVTNVKVTGGGGPQ